MNRLLMWLALNCVRAWTWLYTWRMPPVFRETRRAEIESDLWEFQSDAASDHSFGPALHIFLRLLLGIPDDLGWRVGQAAVTGRLTKGSIALSARVAGATIFICALWLIDADAGRKRSAVTGASHAAVFDQYVKGVMTMRVGHVPHRGGRTLPLLTAGIVATVGVSMQSHIAEQLSPIAVSGPAFEVASIKPNQSGGLRVTMSPQPGGRFIATNAPLRGIIRNAYQLQDDWLIGGPSWLQTDRFDIVAKAPSDVPPGQVRLMLRTLLTDRFKLTMHTETRELSTYTLTMARRDGTPGPQLRQTEADCANASGASLALDFPGPPDPNARCGSFGPGGGGGARFRGVTMEAFARFLASTVHRTVVDRSGLAGHYDLDLEQTSELGPPPPPPGVPDRFDRSSAPSIFTAIQEQLGLKLESTRGAVEVLVIDSVEPPTPD